MQWGFNVSPYLAWGFIPVLLNTLTFPQSPVVCLRPREPQIFGISTCPEHLLGTPAEPGEHRGGPFPTAFRSRNCPWIFHHYSYHNLMMSSMEGQTLQHNLRCAFGQGTPLAKSYDQLPARSSTQVQEI